MKFNWEAQGYRQIINEYLGFKEKRRPRGAIRKLADHLRCHTTFIAQALSGRANFSLEQGFEIGNYFGFSEEEKNFFLLLLMRDRAGTTKLRDYWQQRIEKALVARQDLKNVLSSRSPGLLNHELEYFGDWLYQAIHCYTQLPGQTAVSIARNLSIPVKEAAAILLRLKEMELVTKEKSNWKSTKSFLHLPKSSRHVQALHLTWKTKLLCELQSKASLTSTHYSGALTIAKRDHTKVKEVLLRALKEIKEIAETSASEECHGLSIDFYGL